MRKPRIGSPITAATTEMMTMMAVWLTSFDDIFMINTTIFTMSRHIARKMQLINIIKYL
jgi:hypothetical protein